LRGRLFNPLYIFLAILIALLLIPFREDQMFEQYVDMFVDLLFVPALAIMASLHVVREYNITVFELNMLKGYGTVYLGRVIVYVLALFVGLLPTIILLSITGSLQNYSIALLQKILSYTAVTSVILLLDSPKGGLMISVVFFYLIPYGVLALINRAGFDRSPLSPELAPFVYFFDPLIGTTQKNIIGYTEWTPVITIAFSITVIAIDYIVFTKKEFNI